MRIEVLRLLLFNNKCGVLTAEAEGIGNGTGTFLFPGVIGDIVQITSGIGGVIVDGRRDEIVIHRKGCRNEF